VTSHLATRRGYSAASEVTSQAGGASLLDLSRRELGIRVERAGVHEVARPDGSSPFVTGPLGAMGMGQAEEVAELMRQHP